MKKRIYILIIIIIVVLIFIILNLRDVDLNEVDDIIIFSLWNENNFELNYKNNDKIKIDVFQTAQNSTKVHKKIAPGSYGKFTIKITKPESSNCEIVIRDITQKPQNLIFELNGYKYSSIESMAEEINNIFKYENKIDINWKWEYDIDKEADIQDTIDGQRAEKYIFEIMAIIDQDQRGENIIRKITISLIILFSIISINTICSAKYVVEYTEKAIELEIDRTSPVLQIEYSYYEIKNEEIEVKIIANEEIQEVEGWQLLDDRKTLIKTYYNNIDEIIKIKDLSGNISEINIKIDNIEDSIISNVNL